MTQQPLFARQYNNRSLFSDFYAQPGAYFLTVCVRNRECILGRVEDGRVRLSSLGEIVEACWRSLPRHFPNVVLDAFVVMPNHVHGIITILSLDYAGTSVGAQHAAPLHPGTSPGATPRPNVTPGSLGAMVRSFKAAASLKARPCRGAYFPL